MQAPAVGRLVAAELLGLDVDLDLDPYRLSRFADGAMFPETAIL
jgi:glycine/D-amino acid oxidase-like deaminating enzyme